MTSGVIHGRDEARMKGKRWAGSEIHQVGRNRRTWQEIGYGGEGESLQR